MYNCVNVYARLDFYEAGPAGRESQLVFSLTDEKISCLGKEEH